MKTLRPLLLALPLLLWHAGAHAQTQCYTPREEQDGIDTPKWSYPREKMLAAEKVVRAHAAFRDAPVPVRTRTTLSTDRMHIRAYPEKSLVGIVVWTGNCELIP